MYYGNATRFLNHSCDGGNLHKAIFFTEYTDRHLQRIAFFSSKDIEAGEELTFAYGTHNFPGGCRCKTCMQKTENRLK